MKNKPFYTVLKIAILVMALNPMNLNAQTKTLKDAYKGKFYIGTAMNTPQIKGSDTAAVNIIKNNSVRLLLKTV